MSNGHSPQPEIGGDLIRVARGSHSYLLKVGYSVPHKSMHYRLALFLKGPPNNK